MTQVTVNIPDELARQAEQAGLLRPDELASLLIEAMRKRRSDRLIATMDKLASLEPRLSEAEIDAEIETARIEGIDILSAAAAWKDIAASDRR